MRLDNLFENVKYDISQELITKIFETSNFKLTKIASKKQITKWMTSKDYEIAILLEGSANIEFDDRLEQLKKGDMILIKPLERHRVFNLSPTGLWLCFYFNQIDL